jgi:hypothetical protein
VSVEQPVAAQLPVVMQLELQHALPRHTPEAHSEPAPHVEPGPPLDVLPEPPEEPPPVPLPEELEPTPDEEPPLLVPLLVDPPLLVPLDELPPLELPDVEPLPLELLLPEEDDEPPLLLLPPPSGLGTSRVGTKTEKWLVCAETWLESTTWVGRVVKAVVPTGAVWMTICWGVAPAGRLAGSKPRVTVTGVVKVAPSGPKSMGTPTTVLFAGGAAFGSGVTVMEKSSPRPPSGIRTPASRLPVGVIVGRHAKQIAMPTIAAPKRPRVPKFMSPSRLTEAALA